MSESGAAEKGKEKVKGAKGKKHGDAGGSSRGNRRLELHASERKEKNESMKTEGTKRAVVQLGNAPKNWGKTATRVGFWGGGEGVKRKG